MTTEIEEGEIGTEPLYRAKTDAEIKELAFSVRAGTALGTWQLEQREIGMVFMPFMLSSTLFPKEVERDQIAHFYSYVDDQHTFPRSVNGLPCFHRMYPLDRSDSLRLQESLKQLEAFMGKPDATD